MKPDEERRQLCAESHAARRVLDYALAPVLRKQATIGAGTARENSSPEEDARLRAAIDAWNDINIKIKSSSPKTLAVATCSLLGDSVCAHVASSLLFRASCDLSLRFPAKATVAVPRAPLPLRGEHQVSSRRRAWYPTLRTNLGPQPYAARLSALGTLQ
jgi:hypothetical protein